MTPAKHDSGSNGTDLRVKALPQNGQKTTRHPHEGGCRKKPKSLEPRRTRRAQRKRKALLCALRVLRGSLLFRAFCDSLEGGDQSINSPTSHENAAMS